MGTEKETSAGKKPEKEVNIIVNGREYPVEKTSITFEKVVELAFGSYDTNPDIAYTVSYSWGNSGKEKGVLNPGTSVKVKKEMVFNVTRTNRS
jgi:hypothetical protein